MTTKIIIDWNASISNNLKTPKPDMTSGGKQEEEDEAYVFWYKLNTPLA
jgi:hypothetical protein